MKAKPIIVGAVVAALLLVTIIFITGRPSSPAITVRYLKSVQSGNRVMVTFEVTNHTAVTYWVAPLTVVRIADGVTNMCFDLMAASTPVLVVRPHFSVSPSFQMSDLPAGVPLRLTLIAEPELTGPKGLFMRLKLRYLWQQKMVSPNPFGSPIFVYRKAVNLLSDEFVEPETNQSGQGSSDR